MSDALDLFGNAFVGLAQGINLGLQESEVRAEKRRAEEVAASERLRKREVEDRDFLLRKTEAGQQAELRRMQIEDLQANAANRETQRKIDAAELGSKLKLWESGKLSEVQQAEVDAKLRSYWPQWEQDAHSKGITSEKGKIAYRNWQHQLLAANLYDQVEGGNVFASMYNVKRTKAAAAKGGDGTLSEMDEAKVIEDTASSLITSVKALKELDAMRAEAETALGNKDLSPAMRTTLEARHAMFENLVIEQQKDIMDLQKKQMSSRSTDGLDQATRIATRMEERRNIVDTLAKQFSGEALADLRQGGSGSLGSLSSPEAKDLLATSIEEARPPLPRPTKPLPPLRTSPIEPPPKSSDELRSDIRAQERLAMLPIWKQQVDNLERSLRERGVSEEDISTQSQKLRNEQEAEFELKQREYAIRLKAVEAAGVRSKEKDSEKAARLAEQLKRNPDVRRESVEKKPGMSVEEATRQIEEDASRKGSELKAQENNIFDIERRVSRETLNAVEYFATKGIAAKELGEAIHSGKLSRQDFTDYVLDVMPDYPGGYAALVKTYDDLKSGRFGRKGWAASK